MRFYLRKSVGKDYQRIFPSKISSHPQNGNRMSIRNILLASIISNRFHGFNNKKVVHEAAIFRSALCLDNSLFAHAQKDIDSWSSWSLWSSMVIRNNWMVILIGALKRVKVPIEIKIKKRVKKKERKIPIGLSKFYRVFHFIILHY